MKKTLVKSFALAFVGSLLVAGSAMAIPQMDFGMVAPTVGTISYAGGVNALVGTDINVDNVAGLDTLLNDAFLGATPFALFGGKLNFTTGAGASNGHWDGGASSSIKVTGGVDVNGNGIYDAGVDIALDTVLMTGSFGTIDIYNLGGVLKLAGGAFTDYKNPDVLDLFGLPKFMADGSTPLPYNGGFNLSFNANYNLDGNAFTSISLASGDIVNTPTPEPATMLLLGSGLVGLAGARRRKAKK